MSIWASKERSATALAGGTPCLARAGDGIALERACVREPRGAVEQTASGGQTRSSRALCSLVTLGSKSSRSARSAPEVRIPARATLLRPTACPPRPPRPTSRRTRRASPRTHRCLQRLRRAPPSRSAAWRRAQVAAGHRLHVRPRLRAGGELGGRPHGVGALRSSTACSALQRDGARVRADGQRQDAHDGDGGDGGPRRGERRRRADPADGGRALRPRRRHRRPRGRGARVVHRDLQGGGEGPPQHLGGRRARALRSARTWRAARSRSPGCRSARSARSPR